ncbi:hypothetical protein AMTRI_Chr12g238920 [Amborella trichopoda]
MCSIVYVHAVSQSKMQFCYQMQFDAVWMSRMQLILVPQRGFGGQDYSFGHTQSACGMSDCGYTGWDCGHTGWCYPSPSMLITLRLQISHEGPLQMMLNLVLFKNDGFHTQKS